MTYPTARLDTLCQAVNVGHVGPSSMHRDPNGVPFLMGRNVGEGLLITHNVERVTQAFHNSQPKSKIRAGDVLVVRIGKSGQAAKVPEILGEANCSGLVIIKRPSGIDAGFLAYYLNSPDGRRSSLSEARGSTRLTLNTGSVAAARVPVPPLAEQRRIVAILDEAFADIAVAKANAEKNLESTRALFLSRLNHAFIDCGEGWVEKALGDFCSFENGDRGTNYPSKSARTTTGIPFVNAGHLTEDGIDLESMDYISKERFDMLSNGKIRPGDILFCLRGSLGKFASVRNLSQGAIASSLVILRPDETVLDDLMLAYLRSELCSMMIDRFKNGAAQPNLSARSLRQFVMPIPPKSQQEGIVEELAAFRKDTRSLESTYERKLAALDDLKQSLLQQAFTGQLTAGAG